MAVQVESAPARGYPREYYEARLNPMLRAEIRHLIALAAVRPQESVLELGCGGGQFLSACARHRPLLLMGTDLNREAMALSRRVAPAAAFALADAARLPFDDGSFDVIVAQHLIEHFERPDELLLEWRRVLSASGRIVIATPNAQHPDTVLFDDPTHRRIYDTCTLRQLFAGNGFSVDRCYTLMPFLGNRRLTWTAAKWTMSPLLVLRFLPYFRDRGLTLFLAAKKQESTSHSRVEADACFEPANDQRRPA